MEDIHMNKSKNQFIETVKSCFAKLGLTVKEVSQKESFTYLDSELHYADEPLGIRVLLDTGSQTLAIGIAYGIVPHEKEAVIRDLIGRINALIVVSKYIMEPYTGALVLQSGMCITDNGLGENEFLAPLKRLLADNYEFARLIGEQLSSTSTPAEIIDKYLRDKNEPCKCFMRLEEEKCTLH